MGSTLSFVMRCEKVSKWCFRLDGVDLVLLLGLTTPVGFGRFFTTPLDMAGIIALYYDSMLSRDSVFVV